MNEEIKEKTQTLAPFTKLCMTIGQLPTSYIESMSYYEQLIWFTKFLQDQVIPAVNQNAAAVEELQGYYLELQNYVNNYFENLDVQEEINNKLDEMAIDGRLTDLIKAYVDPIYQSFEADILRTVNNQNATISTINNKVNSAVSGAPLIAETAGDMTDTTRIYVLITDGHWYYYDGDSWEDGGVYQASVPSPSIESLQDQIDAIYTNSTEITYTNSTSVQYQFVKGRKYKFNVTITAGTLNLATRETGSGSNYETIKNGITSNQSFTFIPNKANGQYLRVSVTGGATGTIEIIDTLCLTEMYDSIEDLENIPEFVEKFDNNYTYPTQLTTIKDLNEDLEDYNYASFGNGIYHKGKEIFVERASISHTTPASSSDYGKIIAIIRDEDGNITNETLELPYESIDGELRDPNISVTRDGTLILGCFATKYTDLVPSYQSVLFVLNDNLQVTSWCFVSTNDDIRWGNTIQTPNGFLLTASYNNKTSPYCINIYRSNTAFTGSLSGITFTKINTIFNQTTGSANTEPTLGYYKDKLLLVARFGYWITENLEGTSGWGDRITFSGSMTSVHSPQILPYSDENLFLICGSQYISSSLRKPFIGILNLNNGKIIQYALLYTDDNIGFGGYPAFVRLDYDLFSTIFYRNAEDSSSTALYYTQFNRRKLLSMNYN